jgi:alginate O-acetyltransferase complex protein AlgI
LITSGIYWLVLFGGVLVFWLLPQRWRLGFLAALSFGYLLSLDWQAGCTMLAFTLAAYFLASVPRQGAGRWLTPVVILAALAYLAWFKYTPGLLELLGQSSPGARLAIPLGISYFTFKLIHYTVEAGRGNVANRSISSFLSYMFLFPIFTGGPIERFDHYLQNQEHRCCAADLFAGLQRIAHGLIKRFVLVEHLLQPMATRDFLAKLPELGMSDAWVYCILTFLAAYLDFSALSDLAIGSSRLFGLRIMENFNWPILARNIGDYWRRWHMSLVAWCQTYVYLPTIGLTRQPYVASYATFLTMGLWHAGTLHWVGWGLYHATGLVVFRAFDRTKRQRGWDFLNRGLWRFGGMPLTFLFVSAGSAFPSVWGHGSAWDSLRILAKLMAVDLAP